jgi:hypothetical protein
VPRRPRSDFHQVAPGREATADPRGFHAVFGAIVDSLSAPRLHDDARTRYAPVTNEPVSAHSGGLLDPERPVVVTGHWRYHPAPPDDAGIFLVELGGTRWTLT